MKDNTIWTIADPKAAVAFLDAWERLMPKPIITEQDVEHAKLKLVELGEKKNKGFWDYHLIRVYENVIKTKN